jgi:hypothetical protein
MVRLVVIGMVILGLTVSAADAGGGRVMVSTLLHQGPVPDAHVVALLDGHLGVGRAMGAHVGGVTRAAVALP